MAKDNKNPEEDELERKQRVIQEMEKLKKLGIDPQLLFEMMGGVARGIVKESEQILSGLIDQKIKILGDSLAGQIKQSNDELGARLNKFIDDIQKQAGAAGADVPPAAAAAPSADLPPGPGLAMDPAATGGPLGAIKQYMPILQMLGLVPGTAGPAAGPTAGLAQMKETMNFFSEIMNSFYNPMSQHDEIVERRLLNRLNTFSKTGGVTPWDPEYDKTQTEPGRQVAALNQPAPDLHQIAFKMSRDMKIV